MYIGNSIVYYKIIIKRQISYNMLSHLHDDSTMGDSINATLYFVNTNSMFDVSLVMKYQRFLRNEHGRREYSFRIVS